MKLANGRYIIARHHWPRSMQQIQACVGEVKDGIATFKFPGERADDIHLSDLAETGDQLLVQAHWTFINLKSLGLTEQARIYSKPKFDLPDEFLKRCIVMQAKEDL